MNHLIARAIRRKFNVRVSNHTLPIPCSRSRTRNDLCDLWGDLGYERGAEIGVRTADYSLEILTRNEKCHLLCIDPWCEYDASFFTTERQEKNYATTLDRLKPFIDADRATVWRMKSMEALEKVPDESLDFVFIDGDHMFDMCMLDLIYWPKKVKQDGMIAVHDYMPMVRGGVRPAVDAYTHCHQIAPWYVICEQLPTAFWVKE